MRLTQYTAYGLVIQSEFPCPELLPANHLNVNPDVAFRFGPTPTSLLDRIVDGSAYQASQNHFWLNVDSVARFMVSDGNEVMVQLFTEPSDSQFRLYLLGSCLGALLYQRSFLALHASAISTEHGAVLFAGPSGIGKSTLLGKLMDRGYRMLTDDVAGITLDKYGRPILWPAIPRTKLWADTARRLYPTTDSLVPIYSRIGSTGETTKFGVATHDRFESKPTPVHSVYFLSTQQDEHALTIQSLSGVRRFSMLKEQIYLRRFVPGLPMQASEFRQIIQFAGCTRMAAISRPQVGDHIDELADCVEKDLMKQQETGRNNNG